MVLLMILLIAAVALQWWPVRLATTIRPERLADVLPARLLGGSARDERIAATEEMRAAVLERLPEASLVVMAAAVSDYRVAQVAEQKIKRDGPRTLQLEPTADILKEIVARRGDGTLVIGFAAETENVLANGRAKLERKGVDALVVNDVSGTATGFDSDSNAGTFLTAEGAVDLPLGSKTAMAAKIFDQVAALRLRTAKV